jgi:hypothetical protein
MKKIYLLKQSFVLSTTLLLFTHYIQAQNIFPSTGSAGIGTPKPDASSILEMVSTSQGMLVPRMTIAQRNAIPLPATGLLIFQTGNASGFYYYNGTVWAPVTAKSWLLTGNAGTGATKNFIGTTDAQPLLFKVNNQEAGYLDNINGNTGFGYQTLNSNTGAVNTANGFNALFKNTTGYYNTATGGYALQNNIAGIGNTANGTSALRHSTGSNNTASGLDALYANTTGYSNVAMGAYSLFNNTTESNLVAIGDSTLYNNGIGTGNQNQAINNTAVGSKALLSNNTGSNNTANGSGALYSNTTGSTNTATGSAALYLSTTGSWNTANGGSALSHNTSGSNNTANGSYALYSDTSGSDNTANGFEALFSNTSGSDNTATGEYALNANTIGTYNTANGVYALYHNTTGYYNTANGVNALWHNDAGVANTADGYQALYSNTTGNYNTALGYHADVLTGGLTNATSIGYLAAVDASNKVRVGNTDVTSIGGQVGWTTFSDGRYKKNIKEDVKGLSFINSLQPITYTVDVNGLNDYFDKGRKHDSAYEKKKASMQPSTDEAAKIIYNGFIAQDVEAAAKKLNYDFSGVDKPKTKDGLYGLRYSDFVVPLVKAVQELSTQNDELKKQNDDLAQRLAKLEAIMNVQQSTINLSSASLGQNVPNPFSKATTINYSLPQKYLSAKIIVIDESGNTIRIFNLSGTGKGTLNFSSPFRVGASYEYLLLVDGKLIDTKQMVLAK